MCSHTPAKSKIHVFDFNTAIIHIGTLILTDPEMPVWSIAGGIGLNFLSVFYFVQHMDKIASIPPKGK